MNHTLKAAAAGCAAVLLLAGGPTAANATYLGYGNGDPGNWDLATEQKGGPCVGVNAEAGARYAGRPACCKEYTPESACRYPARKAERPRRTKLGQN